jgi:hypothetical protein
MTYSIWSGPHNALDRALISVLRSVQTFPRGDLGEECSNIELPLVNFRVMSACVFNYYESVIWFDSAP